MSFKTLEMVQDDAVATVRLNRPAQYNTLNGEMAEELLKAAQRVQRDPAIRALVLTGAGAAFCGGGDVKAFVAAGDSVPELLESLIAPWHHFITTMVRLGKPTVAAVNGVAAGGGFSLAMCCDLVLAAQGASFLSAFSKIGASPDGGLSAFLPRMIGPRRALELYLTNRALSAEEALDWGLVTRVVPAAHLMDEAHTLARELAAGPTAAYGRGRELIYESLDHSLETQLELEARRHVDSTRTADYREAIRAFVEKRKAAFQGR